MQALWADLFVIPCNRCLAWNNMDGCETFFISLVCNSVDKDKQFLCTFPDSFLS
jgi:hypothetical protein